MKRSPLPPRKTPLSRSDLPLKRTPLKRATKPIARFSERRESEREARAVVVALVRRRDKVCQGGAVHALARVPCEGPLDCHEIIARSAWSAGYLEPSNCVLLCRASHMHVTTHPHFGHAIGLVKWSWERPVVKPRENGRFAPGRP